MVCGFKTLRGLKMELLTLIQLVGWYDANEHATTDFVTFYRNVCLLSQCVSGIDGWVMKGWLSVWFVSKAWNLHNGKLFSTYQFFFFINWIK